MKFAKRMHAEALEISHREDADVEQTNHADVPFVPYKQLKKRIKRLSQSTSHGTYPYDNGAAAEAVDAAAGGGGWYAEPLDQGQSDNDQCRAPCRHEDSGLEQGRGYGDDERAESDAFLVELDQVCEELDAWFIKLAQTLVKRVVSSRSYSGAIASSLGVCGSVKRTTARPRLDAFHDDGSIEAAREAVQKLLKWSQLNSEALRKITKKRDKNLGGASGAEWLTKRPRTMAFYAQSPLLAELRAVERMFTSERGGHARADSRILSACSRARSESLGSGKEAVSEESEEELEEELEHSEPELELDCPVCLDLLYKPMAYGCGHTVCKPCHKRTVANTGGGDERCPVCRHAGQQVVKLRVMRRLIRDQHPQEARARRAQEARTRAKEAEEKCKAAHEARVPSGVYRPTMADGMLAIMTM
eukprot:CAMPEP_0182572824 /NCGR_PEP_ID=MMETSP1324-20130603/17913_1 /TAXON_ID=236786 /ORGANISM="Florenciella sp., Strain RCC1587" /LENGTH=416 /DNA_ID=CAMNT_0024787839 /DNA_START=133 /DNA_END=1383 /DNA_ORIENTATION=-